MVPLRLRRHNSSAQRQVVLSSMRHVNEAKREEAVSRCRAGLVVVTYLYFHVSETIMDVDENACCDYHPIRLARGEIDSLEMETRKVNKESKDPPLTDKFPLECSP